MEQISFGYTNASSGDSTQLLYLRSRFYASGTGRFLTRDTWGGNANSPMSFNRWAYVDGNPVNYTDPTGNWPCVLDLSGKAGWTGIGWTDQDIKKRVDVAEKYVSPTSDPMDTYVAAGIAIQCAGFDESNPYSGTGIAQITQRQVETKLGETIYEYDADGNKVPERVNFWTIKKDKHGNIIYKIRGYGLRIECPDGQLEAVRNPKNTHDAVVLMKREIQLVTGSCGSRCTLTDFYIATALAQNGIGFSYVEIQDMGKFTNEADRLKYGVFRDWFTYFKGAEDKGNTVNTKTQLNRFILVINELAKRRWTVPVPPEINSDTIERLKN